MAAAAAAAVVDGDDDFAGGYLCYCLDKRQEDNLFGWLVGWSIEIWKEPAPPGPPLLYYKCPGRSAARGFLVPNGFRTNQSIFNQLVMIRRFMIPTK